MNAIVEGFSFFDGEIRVLKDEQGRITKIGYFYLFNGKPIQAACVDIWPDRGRAVFTDGQYSREEYEGGAAELRFEGVEEGVPQGASAFDDWIARKSLEVLQVTASGLWILQRLLGPLWQAPRAQRIRGAAEAALASYDRYFRLAETTPEREVFPMVALGWSVCALLVEREPERAAALLRARYPTFKAQLANIAPQLRELLSAHVAPELW